MTCLTDQIYLNYKPIGGPHSWDLYPWPQANWQCIRTANKSMDVPFRPFLFIFILILQWFFRFTRCKSRGLIFHGNFHHHLPETLVPTIPACGVCRVEVMGYRRIYSQLRELKVGKWENPKGFPWIFQNGIQQSSKDMLETRNHLETI